MDPDSVLDFEDDDFVSADLNQDNDSDTDPDADPNADADPDADPDDADVDAPDRSPAVPLPDADAEADDPSGIGSSGTKKPAISKFLKGKEREWEALSQLPGPLTLLKLPVDVLHLIVNEVGPFLPPFYLGDKGLG